MVRACPSGCALTRPLIENVREEENSTPMSSLQCDVCSADLLICECCGHLLPDPTEGEKSTTFKSATCLPYHCIWCGFNNVGGSIRRYLRLSRRGSIDFATVCRAQCHIVDKETYLSFKQDAYESVRASLLQANGESLSSSRFALEHDHDEPPSKRKKVAHKDDHDGPPSMTDSQLHPELVSYEVLLIRRQSECRTVKSLLKGSSPTSTRALDEPFSTADVVMLKSLYNVKIRSPIQDLFSHLDEFLAARPELEEIESSLRDCEATAKTSAALTKAEQTTGSTWALNFANRLVCGQSRANRAAAVHSGSRFLATQVEVNAELQNLYSKFDALVSGRRVEGGKVEVNPEDEIGRIINSIKLWRRVYKHMAGVVVPLVSGLQFMDFGS